LKYFFLKLRELLKKHQDKRRESRRTLCGAFFVVIPGESVSRANAQGIEAEIPQALPAVKSRNWSGKPGFRRFAPEMRPKENP
jgi:hypothetical protein